MCYFYRTQAMHMTHGRRPVRFWLDVSAPGRRRSRGSGYLSGSRVGASSFTSRRLVDNESRSFGLTPSGTV